MAAPTLHQTDCQETAMTTFQFTAVSGTYVKSQVSADFETLDDARREARGMLTALASERLAVDPCEMFSVEIFDDAAKPLAELRLLYQEIEK
jgi:hypothetical protein